MKALVLSGGGAKGSYQIGVWKALKKLHIKIDIVTGTSSGAINGALITQNSYFRALKVWKTLTYEKIIGKEFELKNKNDIYKTFIKNFINKKGTNVEKLQQIIYKYLKTNKIYRSKINYGLVTYNVTTRKVEELEKKDIPKEKLGEYILASASCFPVFQMKEINGSNYIDGGYYDNLPINLAIRLGATEVIAVDLEAPGLKKKPSKKIDIITIRPNNDLNDFLLFNPNQAKRNMKYGYNDTMKIMNKLEGKKYTFKKKEIDKLIKKYRSTYNYIISQLFTSPKQADTFLRLLNIDLKVNEKVKREIIYSIIDDIGYKYNLDDSRIYKINKFNKILKKKIKEIQKNKIEDNVIHFYDLLRHKKYTKLKKEAFLKPFDLVRAIYIYTILED